MNRHIVAGSNYGKIPYKRTKYGLDQLGLLVYCSGVPFADSAKVWGKIALAVLVLAHPWTELRFDKLHVSKL